MDCEKTECNAALWIHQKYWNKYFLINKSFHGCFYSDLEASCSKVTEEQVGCFPTESRWSNHVKQQVLIILNPDSERKTKLWNTTCAHFNNTMIIVVFLVVNNWCDISIQFVEQVSSLPIRNDKTRSGFRDCLLRTYDRRFIASSTMTQHLTTQLDCTNSQTEELRQAKWTWRIESWRHRWSDWIIYDFKALNYNFPSVFASKPLRLNSMGFSLLVVFLKSHTLATTRDTMFLSISIMWPSTTFCSYQSMLTRRQCSSTMTAKPRTSAGRSDTSSGWYLVQWSRFGTRTKWRPVQWPTAQLSSTQLFTSACFLLTEYRSNTQPTNTQHDRLTWFSN